MERNSWVVLTELLLTITRCKAKAVKSKPDPYSPLLPRWSLEYRDSRWKIMKWFGLEGALTII